MINAVCFELLARHCYAIKVGVSQVRAHADWLRLNPRASDPRRNLVRAAESEVRTEMQRDALFAKARQDWSGRLGDPINAQG